MIKNYLIIVILTIIMIGATGYGLFQSGSPFESRGRKFDEQRISDLVSLTYTIENYYSKNGSLPSKLTDLSSDYTYGDQKTKDPETSQEYQFKPTGPLSYNLCAKFSTDTTKLDENKNNYRYYLGNDKFKHPKGDYCFDLKVNEDLFTPKQSFTQPVVQNNQEELVKRGRDAARLSDLANLQQAINVTFQEATESSDATLCSNKSVPCSGRSIDTGINSRNSDGTGWIKVNLSSQKSISVPTLPTDPTNSGIIHYTYCSDGKTWEINTVLESAQQAQKMINDGGDDSSKYEIGSLLTLIGTENRCKY